ncbi:MbtH protein [Saccharopolyspora antimicrobica]|uniref:MbtH protein n=1 Tax=Saccharopolyspora antimicrobica TaxID=455193 RepID=A0A1I5C3K7_9PSEU|nr:MbtH family NRPS accessory protein [Saccharopolyspora antimicrobica]RKT88981.1 MbtH protein [Saccharopolyspora antimicrobica]SFN81603.1 MbtH protein [Saccharopolyspora antimicrobica]
MSNPFEDESRDYLALRNVEEQYSIWPQGVDVPAGWRVVRGPAPRQEIIDYIGRSWTDMRPKSLREAMTANGSAPA